MTRRSKPTVSEIKRLLFTDEPFEDESFTGYILRLAEMNAIINLNWIFKLININKHYQTKYRYISDSRVDVPAMAKLTDIDENTIRRLLYVDNSEPTNPNEKGFFIRDYLIPLMLVRRQNPKLCTACLKETNYCRKIWEIVGVTVCPIHRSMLIDICPQCLEQISWERPTINNCRCGYDFRKVKKARIPTAELQLTKHIYQVLQLPFSSPIKASAQIDNEQAGEQGENFSQYPLNTLSLHRLMKVLAFVGIHYAQKPNYHTCSLSDYKDNATLHRTLFKAVRVFDD